jgi:multidrug efflux pump subunit AcrA (membrane-fusion protein)
LFKFDTSGYSVTIMRKYQALFSIILILLTGMLALSCTPKTDTAAANQTAAVQRGNLNINILASGNLVTAHEENLAFYSAGTVQEVLVKIGDRVESGKELAKLDKSTLESNLIDAQIKVEQARINLGNAETGNDGKAPDPLNIQSMEQALKSAEAKLALAEDLLQKATIIAPFKGLIADVNVVPGDQISASTVAVRLIDPVNFQTDVLVNEMDVYQLSIGTPATVQANAQPTYTFPAKISLIAETPTISSNVVNYKVTVQLDPVTPATVQALAAVRTQTGITPARNRMQGTGGQTTSAQSGNQTASDNRTYSRPAFSGQQSDNRTAANNRAAPTRTAPTGQAATTVAQDFRLREGLTVTVSIIAEQRADILLVPNKAITSRSGRYYVQLVSAGATTEKQIQAGITDGQNTEVISGLSEGDMVSTATNIAVPASTTSSQQRSSTPSIPGVRLPGAR